MAPSTIHISMVHPFDDLGGGGLMLVVPGSMGYISQSLSLNPSLRMVLWYVNFTS